MTDDERRAVAIFKKAVALLKTLGPEFQLYVAGNTLCLMQGDSHDEGGRPRREAVLDSAGGINIGGGDW